MKRGASEECPVEKQGKNMKRKIPVLTLCAMLFALCGSVEAQQPKKILRIGYLSSFDPASDSNGTEAIRRALRELGYIEGQNIVFEYRYAEGKLDRFPELAAELMGLKVDIIVVLGGNGTVRAAKNATKTIPIVMTGGGIDPVEAGVDAPRESQSRNTYRRNNGRTRQGKHGESARAYGINSRNGGCCNEAPN